MQTTPPVRHRSRPTTTRNAAANTVALRLEIPDALKGASISQRAIDSLTPYKRNARTHSSKQIAKLAASITEFGFVNPILVDAEDNVIAGHGRLEAARSLGMTAVPTIRIDHLTGTQLQAYRIADNKLAELAGWDSELLKIELAELSAIDLAFPVEVTGFEMVEIDVLLEEPVAAKSDPADDVPAVAATPVSRLGDLWMLGEHRLLCADAQDPASIKTLLAGEAAQMVFTDPPYNVRIANVGGLGQVRHDEFVMASGEMSRGRFTEFLTTVLTNLAQASIDGAIHYVCMDWRHLEEVLGAGRAAYSELKNICVWAKDNGGMGSFYRSQHELILVFKNGTVRHINNFGLGKKGRYRTNVWSYAGVNTFKAGRQDELGMHPTVKPVALVADAIRDCSKRGGIILDAFSGSGTTIIAAAKTGRRGYALELDPKYVDVAVRRWQGFAKADAVHAATGLTFAEMAARRAAEPPPDPEPDPGDSLADEPAGAAGEVRHG